MDPYCSPVTRARIVDYIDSGLSTYEVARRVMHHPTTVARVYKRYYQNHDFYHSKSKPGRPRKLTRSDVQFAALMLAQNKARNVTELQQKYFKGVSAETLRQALKKIGLFARVRRKVPHIPAKNRRFRRAWCRYTITLPRSYWSHIIYSDECRAKLFGSDGLDWCWQRQYEVFDARYTKKYVAHDHEQVMVWGCITSAGAGRLRRIDGTLDAEKYVSVLEQGLLGTLKDYNLNPLEVVFQHDNDPKHKSRKAQDWLLKLNSFLVLPWPSNSPDLNVIENIWAHLKRCIRRRSVKPRNADELWAALEEEWLSIDPSVIVNLYNSIPRRIRAVLKNRGRATRY